MRKNLTVGLILSAAMAFGSVAIAANHGGHEGDRGGSHGHHRGHGHEMAFKKLDLTDTQRASIKQIVHNGFAQNKSQRQALRQQREAFRSITPDQVGYQTAATRLAQAEGQATQLRVQQKATVRAQIYAVLTPAQKAKMATMRASQQARREQWKTFKAQHPVDAENASSAQ
ncbi:MAG: Spy/CpxP family protein refolding chaperone [Rhodanobacter sp.]